MCCAGIDSRHQEDGVCRHQYTGDETKTIKSNETVARAQQVVALAGEIARMVRIRWVRQGYDIEQLKAQRLFGASYRLWWGG